MKRITLGDDPRYLYPINKSAAGGLTASRDDYAPQKRVCNADSSTPIAVRAMPPNASQLPDLKGFKFGRFTVMGYARDYSGRWVVRCCCGRYSVRTTRACRSPNNTLDRCEHCRHQFFLRREEHWRNTGRDIALEKLA